MKTVLWGAGRCAGFWNYKFCLWCNFMRMLPLYNFLLLKAEPICYEEFGSFNTFFCAYLGNCFIWKAPAQQRWHHFAVRGQIPPCWSWERWGVDWNIHKESEHCWCEELFSGNESEFLFYFTGTGVWFSKACCHLFPKEVRCRQWL